MPHSKRHARPVACAVLALAICLSLPAGGMPAQELPALVASGARVERIARGFAFVDGPAADADGALYFTDIPNNRIHRWTPDEGLTTFREDSGGANGLRFDADGALIACEMGNRRVTGTDPAAACACWRSATTAAGSTARTTCGSIRKGDLLQRSALRSGRRPRDGRPPRLLPHADGTDVLRVADDMERPNGIIGSADGTRVYIADHGGGRTYVYTPAPDGTLANKRLFVEQGSDGMTMDEMGNVYLTGEDVIVYDPGGDVAGSIAVPEAPANLTFGGPKRTTLFITARTSVYAVEMFVSGQ